MGRKSCKILTALIICFLAACVKDKPEIANNIPANASGNIYIVCEGNYGIGNASLYLYQPTRDSVYGDIYKAANNQPLGDVFQSMTRIGDQFFLCVNNSNKVVVINATNWKVTATISVPQPRDILSVSNNKAYVSSLYHNSVYIINTQTFQQTGTINFPNQNTEGMCLYYNNAFICTWDTAGNNIYKVNTTTDQIIQTIKVAGSAPQEVLLDKEQMLWVLSGNQPQGKTATLTRLDPSTGQILASYQFSVDVDPLHPAFNKTKDTLYFIEANYYGGTSNNGVYRMDIHAAALPSRAFVQALQYQYFWALGIDPLTDDIYIGDPKGFTQRGSVYVYGPDGTQIKSFNVGLGPGHFYFDE